MDTGKIIQNGRFQTTYSPIGDCVNKEVQLQSPDDPEIWETVGTVSFINNECVIGSSDYEGWLATVSYIYAEKIIIENFEFVDSMEELVKNFYDYNGTVYRVILTVEPLDTVILKWVDNNTGDFFEESITTKHIRYIAEEEFNN